MEIIEDFIKRSIVPFDNEMKKLNNFSYEIEMNGDDACPMRQLIILLRFIEKCKFPVITTTNVFLRLFHYNDEFAKELEFLSMCNANVKLNVLMRYSYKSYIEIFKKEQPKRLVYNVFYKIDKIHETLTTNPSTYILNVNDVTIVFDKRTPNSKTLILAPDKILVTDKINFRNNEGNLS